MSDVKKFKARTSGTSYDIRDPHVSAMFNNRAEHNAHFNELNLGTVTNQSEMDELISDWGLNSLTELHPDVVTGAYIQINDGTYNKAWMIDGFDLHKNMGVSNIITSPSVTIQPRTALVNQRMYSTDVTYVTNATDGAGGYYASEGKAKVDEIATSLKNSVFGNHLAQRDVLITMNVNKDIASMAGLGWLGASVNWNWYPLYMVLPTEKEYTGSSTVSSSFMDQGSGYMKLPVYNFISPIQYAKEYQWTCSVASGTNFVYVNNGGGANGYLASNAYGLRPLADLV